MSWTMIGFLVAMAACFGKPPQPKPRVDVKIKNARVKLRIVK